MQASYLSIMQPNKGNNDVPSFGFSTRHLDGDEGAVSSLSPDAVRPCPGLDQRCVNFPNDHHQDHIQPQTIGLPTSSPTLHIQYSANNYITDYGYDGSGDSNARLQQRTIQFLEVSTRQVREPHRHQETGQRQLSQSAADIARRPDSFDIMRCKDPHRRSISWADTVADPSSSQSGPSYRRSYEDSRPMTPFPEPDYSEFVDPMQSPRSPSPSPPRQHTVQIRREDRHESRQHVPQIRITDPTGATWGSPIRGTTREHGHHHRHRNSPSEDPFPPSRVWGLIGAGVSFMITLTSLMAAISFLVVHQQTDHGEPSRSIIAWCVLSALTVFGSLYAMLVLCIGRDKLFKPESHLCILCRNRRRSSQRGALPLVTSAAPYSQAQTKEYEMRSRESEQGGIGMVLSRQSDENLNHHMQQQGHMRKILKQPSSLAVHLAGSGSGESKKRGDDDTGKRKSTLSAKTTEILEHSPRPATIQRPHQGLVKRNTSAEPLLQSGDE